MSEFSRPKTVHGLGFAGSLLYHFANFRTVMERETHTSGEIHLRVQSKFIGIDRSEKLR